MTSTCMLRAAAKKQSELFCKRLLDRQWGVSYTSAFLQQTGSFLTSPKLKNIIFETDAILTGLKKIFFVSISHVFTEIRSYGPEVVGRDLAILLCF